MKVDLEDSKCSDNVTFKHADLAVVAITVFDGRFHALHHARNSSVLRGPRVEAAKTIFSPLGVELTAWVSKQRQRRNVVLLRNVSH